MVQSESHSDRIGNILLWLARIEKKAGELYTEVSMRLKGADSHRQFFKSLADDELYHQRVLEDARSLLMSPRTVIDWEIIPDERAIAEMEKPFQVLEKALTASEIDRNEILRLMADLETSEWNDVFYYFVDVLKTQGRQFQKAVSQIQRHSGRIESFLRTEADKDGSLQNLIRPAPVWKNRFLVVDDSEPVSSFLATLLGRMGTVETAKTGNEGLHLATEQYYDVIVSDVQMPEMDGTDFLTQLTAHDPECGKRFLFLTGELDDDLVQFFKRYTTSYLEKPADVADIVREVNCILGNAD